MFRLSREGQLVPVEAKRDRDTDSTDQESSSKKQKPLKGDDPRVIHPERVFNNRATKRLYKKGYVVIDLGLTQEALLEIRKSILEELKCFKELSPQEKEIYLKSETTGVPQDFERQFAMGGFSALGTPDSFHCPQVRDLRMQLHEMIFEPLMEELREDTPDGQSSSTGSPRRNLETLIDRILVREPGKAPTAESWHRDESKDAEPTDTIMGGWLNLNSSKNQTFSMIPQTHRLFENESTSGFNTFKKEQTKGFNDLKRQIKIPPGHLLVFYQNSIHEVVSKKQKDFIQWRLFTGVRLTFSNQPLVSNLAQLLDEQAVIPLKSGQVAPMYASMHLNFANHVRNLDTFTHKNLVVEMQEPYTGGFSRSTAKKPRSDDVVQEFSQKIKPKTKKRQKPNGKQTDTRQAPSLRALGLPLYLAYTPEELSIYGI